jgi:AcrR family transcriptional regulator
VKAADTSKGGVYFHFPSKQDIFLGLVDEFADMLEQRISQAIEHQGSGIQRVDAALRACLNTFQEYRKLTKIFLVQAVGLGLVYEEKQQQVHDRFVVIVRTHLDEAIHEGNIDPLDTQIAAYAWMGAINEVVIRWIHTGEPDLERALPALRSFLLRSIGVSNNQIEQLNCQENKS